MDDSSLPMSTASLGGQTRCGSHCVSQSECRLQTADLGATVGTCPNLPAESGKDRRARRVCAVALQVLVNSSSLSPILFPIRQLGVTAPSGLESSYAEKKSVELLSNIVDWFL